MNSALFRIGMPRSELNEPYSFEFRPHNAMTGGCGFILGSVPYKSCAYADSDSYDAFPGCPGAPWPLPPAAAATRRWHHSVELRARVCMPCALVYVAPIIIIM